MANPQKPDRGGAARDPAGGKGPPRGRRGYGQEDDDERRRARLPGETEHAPDAEKEERPPYSPATRPA